MVCLVLLCVLQLLMRVVIMMMVMTVIELRRLLFLDPAGIDHELAHIDDLLDEPDLSLEGRIQELILFFYCIFHRRAHIHRVNKYICFVHRSGHMRGGLWCRKRAQPINRQLVQRQGK